MCQICDKKNEYLQHDSRKRSFLKLAAASALGLGIISSAGIASEEERKVPLPSSTKIPPQPENVLTPDQALERLMAGSKRHASGQSTVSLDIHTSQDALVKGQTLTLLSWVAPIPESVLNSVLMRLTGIYLWLELLVII